MKTFQRLIAIGAFYLPIALQAHSSEPEPGRTGVPGEGTCSASGCHVGTAVNGGGGDVKVTFPDALTYTPGVRQSLTVTVSDSTARAFGFQLTVRLASNSKTQAGTLITSGSSAFVLCSSTDFVRQSDKLNTCPAAQPIESAEHTEPLRATNGAGSWTLQWIPPATAQGNIVIYVAGNAVNLNGQETGDKVYTANYTLAPAGAAPKPAVSEGGIITAGGFGANPVIASGSWIEIFGSNFASSTGDWGTGFQGDNAPTTTNGVSVTIGGKPAFVSFVSPGQINAQVPGDLGVGPTTLVVKNAAGDSDPRSVTIAARSPGLLSPAVFKVGTNQYLVALHADGSFVLPPGSIAGVASTAAKTGETILLYGVGFGATTPVVAPGVIVRGLPALPNFSIRFGTVQVPPAGVIYAGLAPGFVGLYQFNITVPPGITGPAVPVSVTVDGVNLPQTLVTAIQ